MTAMKLSVLGLWVLFAVLLVFGGDTVWAKVGLWGLILSVLSHGLEMFLYYGRCQRAGGSMPMHMLNVFFFGVLHVKGLPPETE